MKRFTPSNVALIVITCVIAVVFFTRSLVFHRKSESFFVSDLQSPLTDSLRTFSLRDTEPSVSGSRLTVHEITDRWPANMGTQNGSENMPGSKDEHPSELAISEFRQRFLLWNTATQERADEAALDPRSGVSKYLICRCDSGKMSRCGGLADRIKGMMVGYVISTLTDRVLKIEMLSPRCDLNNYLVPNLINWSLPTSFHTTMTKLPPDARIVNMVNHRNFYDNTDNLNFTELLGPQKYVYFKANLDYSLGLQKSKLYNNQLFWMKNLTPDQIQATVFKQLFKLSPGMFTRLQNLLARELPTAEHKLVCAHIRMGKNPTLPSDTDVRMELENLPVVWRFISQHSTTDLHKVFVMTDSTQAEDQARLQVFGSRLVKTPGVIGHVDLSKNLNEQEMCEAMEKVIFDLHLLMNCDVLMVSNSGLSRLAAYVRGSDDQLYCLTGERQVIPCQTRMLKDIFQVMG